METIAVDMQTNINILITNMTCALVFPQHTYIYGASNVDMINNYHKLINPFMHAFAILCFFNACTVMS